MSSPHDGSLKSRGDKENGIGSPKDERSQEEIDEDEREKKERKENRELVYRKIFGILLIMTFILMVINLVQVVTLRWMRNWYWIVLFPAIIFLAFISWAGLIVSKNQDKLFPKGSSKDISMKKGFEKLGMLFKLREDVTVDHPKREDERHWPQRLARAGVLLTIIFNVVAVQFIYLPIFAVPGFNEIVWKATLNTNTPLPAPAVVIFESLNKTSLELGQGIHLSPSDTAWENLCDQVPKLPLNSAYCLAYKTDIVNIPARNGALNERTHLRYAIFNPSSRNGTAAQPAWPNLYPQQAFGLKYAFLYHQDSHETLTTIGFFDPKYVPHFVKALQCGFVTTVTLGTFNWNWITLQEFHTHDRINAFNRTDICRDPIFDNHMSYGTTVTQVGGQPDLGGNDCDLDSPGLDGPCIGSVRVEFGSALQTVYQSGYAKNWIDTLTQEGGVVGFVTFLTWFLSIFVLD